MFSLIAAATVASLPFEYVVDCTGWTGNGQARFTYCYTCRDGKKITSDVVCDARSNGQSVVAVLTSSLKALEWRFEKYGKPGDQTVFVIRGSKTSQIKSVTFTGDIWVPIITRRLALPPQPDAAPMPREKK